MITIESLSNEYKFKYALESNYPIDFWEFTMDVDYLKNKIFNNNFIYDYDYIDCRVESIERYIKFKRHSIIEMAFTSVPRKDGGLDLIGLAKINNNGITYIFGDDLNYLKLIEYRLENI